jgi:SET domain-containing protein
MRGSEEETIITATKQELSAEVLIPGVCVPYEVKPSPIGGVGLFVTAPVPRGTMIWRYSLEAAVVHDEASLNAYLETATQKERLDLLEHGYSLDGVFYDTKDAGRYMNHGTAGNLKNAGNHPDGLDDTCTYA